MKMKRTLSLILAALMLAAALASCAAPSGISGVSANVRLTSSDGESAGAWLTERLGDKLTDRVVLGTEADGCGVDLSGLEDDGYVIRAIGGEVALFARTTDGLDRALRRYAKAVEAGEAVADVTYHEGARIEELLLAGVPIGEYSIAVEDENNYMRSWVTDNAATPFAALIKKACGADVPVGESADHRIVFRRIEDSGFKESSYHYFFEDGDLIFEYAELGGARNAFVKFLENECGWVDLMYGRDELCEADLIDVPAVTDVLCHPRFDGIRLTGFHTFSTENTLARINQNSFIYKYRIESAHHYLGTVWARDYGWFQTGHYPCLTSDDVLETVIEEVSAVLDERIAAGSKIGDDLVSVNMGTQDEDRQWCSCKNCMAIYKNEGSWSGPLIHFLNRFDEAMDEAGYDGLKYPTFGYVGSNRPPRTLVPRDDIYVTFVYNNSCTHHCVDGSQCLTDKTNPDYASFILGWLEKTPNVYVRPAPLLAPMHPYTIIDQVWDDVSWLGSIGVKCIYNEIYTSDEVDTNLIACELWEAMTFDPDMTRTQYYEEAARLFEKYYGDGWRRVMRCVDLLEETENAAGTCWSAWSGGYMTPYDVYQYDFATYRALWDEMLGELESALPGACSAAQENRLKRMIVGTIYEGCFASYYLAYEDYDDERIALLNERWAQMIALAKESGIYGRLQGYHIFDSLSDTAWKGAWTMDYRGDKKDVRLEIITRIEKRSVVRSAPQD